ncbi:hypothetical protein GGR52DRAFT_565547, partial [Hypoxylon sp. FL1284]
MLGRKPNKAWWDIDANEKENVSNRIADICLELAAFQADNMITSADYWIDPLREAEQRDYRLIALRKHYEELGMNCSTYVFSYNDLGPINILIHEGRIIIIDWDLAGYYPLVWVRTKFAICGALDVEQVSGDGNGVRTGAEYRLQVEGRLKDRGYPDVIDAYRQLRK